LTAGAEVHVRPALPDDVEQIHAFVVELAEYERAPEQVTGTVEMLREALFGPRPSAEALIAVLDSETVGFALFHSTFSTWECAAGLWLEDLYVPPRHRWGGAGGALLRALARIALDRGCPRLEWHALDWNDLALGFYERLGAARLSAWELHRLSGDALARVAGV
jgi:GNAT superfamily N-acetyltransferase